MYMQWPQITTPVFFTTPTHVLWSTFIRCVQWCPYICPRHTAGTTIQHTDKNSLYPATINVMTLLQVIISGVATPGHTRARARVRPACSLRLGLIDSWTLMMKRRHSRQLTLFEYCNKRSTMTEQRLRDLAILSIERDISSTINFQQVVDNFSTKERKIVLL